MRRIEEIFNSSSHGVGVLLGIAATAILVVRAVLIGDGWHVVSFSIFGAGLINLYLASTMFHGTKRVKLKHKLNRFDHSSIYVLIASTYTPFTLTVLRGPLGWSIFGIIWGLAFLGITYKVWFYSSKYRSLSMWLYIAMGWFILIAIVPIVKKLPNISLWFLLAGGITYSLGTIFYIKRKIPFSHGIFHLFILGGSVCHFFSIYYLLGR